MKLIKIGVFFLLLAIVLAACGSQMTQIISKEYVLTTELKNGNLFFLGVSDEINGQANPTLSTEPGETITVTLINGGQGQHDLTFPLVKASTGLVTEKGEEASVTFTVPNNDGELRYYDSVGNHADLGMRGVLEIGKGQIAEQSVNGSAQNSAEVLAAFQKGTCGTCHTIAGIPNAKGMVGPDLTNITFNAEEHLASNSYSGSAKSVEEYVKESILKPDVFVSQSCPMGACPANVMPATMSQLLSNDEINS